MNGFRGDDDLRLVNERIHAMHVEAARQRLVRQAATQTPERSSGSVAGAVGWSRRILHGRVVPVVGR